MARSWTARLTVSMVVLALAPLLAAEEPTEPDMAALMEAYAKYGTTGEHHAALAERAGSWSATVTLWPAPGAPPDVSQGTSERTLIMDGRYLLEEFSGETPWGPFQGMGLTAYDNIKQRFVAIWIDSMSTGIMTAESTAISEDRVEYTGDSPDAMSGSYITTRSVETRIDADTYRVEAFTPLPGGGEFRNMQIVYTRR